MYDSDFSCAAQFASSRPATRHWELTCNGDDLSIPVDTIMSAQNWMLERIPADQKLVIIIGEEHKTHMHVLLQHALLMRLKQQLSKNPARSFAFGYELNHDFARDYNADPSKIAGKKEAIAYIASEKGNPPRKDLFHYCAQNDISVRFNDISSRRLKCGYSLIHKQDAFTHDVIRRHRPDLIHSAIIRSQTSKSSDGITLSNLCIIEKAMQHLREVQSRIYVQHCGSLHALGDGAQHQSRDSLYTLFEKEGLAVMAVLPSRRDQNIVNAWRDACASRNIILIHGLNDGQETDYARLRMFAGIASDIDFVPCPA